MQTFNCKVIIEMLFSLLCDCTTYLDSKNTLHAFGQGIHVMVKNMHLWAHAMKCISLTTSF